MTTKPLSPAAQAVLGAYAEHNGGIEGMLPLERAGVAAALRAVADQVAPKEEDPTYLQRQSSEYRIRRQILSIANELDPQP